MKITLEQPSYARQVTIEVGSDDLTISEVWEDLIKPALLALGYHPKNIDELVGEGDDETIGFFVPDKEEGELAPPDGDAT